MRRRLFGETVEPPAGDASLVAYDRALRQVAGENGGDGLAGQFAPWRRSVGDGRGDRLYGFCRIELASERFQCGHEVVGLAPKGEDHAALPDKTGWLSRIGEEGDRLRNADKDEDVDIAECLDRQVDGIGDRLHRCAPATPRHASR